MKRKIQLIVTILLMLITSISILISCDKAGSAKAEIVSKTDTLVVIKINETDGFATLLDTMTYLKDNGELSFEVWSGMVSSIEGKNNSVDLSACWMLYTSDDEMSNAEWGTTVYDDKIYGSAILGAEALTVSVGEYYIWSYDVF